MSQVIPLTSYPSQFIEVELNGKRIFLRVYWQTQDKKWYMDLSDENGTLAAGVGMVLGADLIEQYNLGLGQLWMADLQNTEVDASANDLGVRVFLLYFAPGEEVTV
jgi:hypothetical protein